MVRQGDDGIGDDASNQPIEPGLHPGTGNDDAVTLDPAPVRRIAREDEMRDDARSAVVPIRVKLEGLAARDVVVRVLPGLLIAETFLGEHHGRGRIIRPVRVVRGAIILHARNEHDDVAVVALDGNVLALHHRLHRHGDGATCDFRGEVLRGEQIFAFRHDRLLSTL